MQEQIKRPRDKRKDWVHFPASRTESQGWAPGVQECPRLCRELPATEECSRKSRKQEEAVTKAVQPVSRTARL